MCAVLRAGCHGAGQTIYPSLLPLASLLPPPFKQPKEARKEGKVEVAPACELLSALWDGAGCLAAAEMSVMLESYMEVLADLLTRPTELTCSLTRPPTSTLTLALTRIHPYDIYTWQVLTLLVATAGAVGENSPKFADAQQALLERALSPRVSQAQ